MITVDELEEDLQRDHRAWMRYTMQRNAWITRTIIRRQKMGKPINRATALQWWRVRVARRMYQGKEY